MGKLDEKKAKVSIKLALTRIRLQREKTDNLVKQSKREVADFIRGDRIENARVKTESIIKNDFKLEALEILGFLVDQISPKLAILAKEKTCPEDLKEAVCTIMWAAPRTTVTELNDLRTMLASKFGKQFLGEAMSNKDNCVNARVLHKLSVQIPENYLIYQYMQEIANSYNIDWKAPTPEISTAPEIKDVIGSKPMSETFSQDESGPPVSSQSGMRFPPTPSNDIQFPSVPSGGGNSNVPNFPSVPSSNSNVPNFPSVPSSNSNVPNFPSVPSGGGGSNEPDIPSFDMNNFDQSALQGFGGSSSVSSFPSPPASASNNSPRFPSVPSGNNDLSFPSVPSGGGNSFPSVPSGGGNNDFSFPSVPSSGGNSFPSVPSGGGNNDFSFPSVPSSGGNSFPSVPSGGGNNDLSFPSVPSGNKDTLVFPSIPSSNNNEAPDFDDLNSRFEKLKKKD